MVPWRILIVVLLQVFQVSHVKWSVRVLQSWLIKAATAQSPFILYFLRILPCSALLSQLMRLPRGDKLSGLFDFIDFFIHLSLPVIHVSDYLPLVSPVLQIHPRLILHLILMIVKYLDRFLGLHKLRHLWEDSLLQCRACGWLLGLNRLFSDHLIRTGLRAVHEAWDLLLLSLLRVSRIWAWLGLFFGAWVVA